MDWVLWALTGGLLFLFFLRDAWRYWAISRKAQGKSFSADLTELWNGGATDYMLEHQTDPAMESMRRRIWLEWGCWGIYVFFGFAFWRVVVGLF
jgi:hypothetical protein